MSRMQGRAALLKKLAALPEEIKKDIRKALEQSAEEVADLARQLVPYKDGALQRSIGWTYGSPPKGTMVLAEGGSAVDGTDLKITVYAGNSEAFYARWQEFGTVKMAANPFFFPAYRASRRRIRGRMTRAMKKAARRVAAGGAP